MLCLTVINNPVIGTHKLKSGNGRCQRVCFNEAARQSALVWATTIMLTTITLRHVTLQLLYMYPPVLNCDLIIPCNFLSFSVDQINL